MRQGVANARLNRAAQREAKPPTHRLARARMGASSGAHRVGANRNPRGRGGVPLCGSSSIRSSFWLVNGSVTQHGEQHVAASSRKGDERLIVALALLDLASVVVPGDGVSQSGEGRQEQRSLEHLVAPSGRMFATDGGAGRSSDGSKPCIGGKMCSRSEGLCATSVRSLAAVLTPTPGMLVRTGQRGCAITRRSTNPLNLRMPT